MKTRMSFGPPPPRHTRYAELGYRQEGPGLWRICDISAGEGNESDVGPYYRTKTELLADLASFAATFGCK